jgi:hypothetical protein
MTIEGQLDDSEYRLRQELGQGEIEGEDVQISLNADQSCVFIEFDEERVMYRIPDMVMDGYEMVYGGEE